LIWEKATVHPHARGELLRSPFREPPIFGSSPRPWGTQDCCIKIGFALRFIPTPVGNS